MMDSEAFAGTRCASLFHLWDTLRAGRPYPAWADLDIIDLKPWLGWLYLLDYPDAGSSTGCFTLFGTRLVSRFKVDVTGRATDQVFFGVGTSTVLGSCTGISRQGQASVAMVVAQRRDGVEVEFQQLLLPFAHHRLQPPDRLLGLIQMQPPHEEASLSSREVLHLTFRQLRAIQVQATVPFVPPRTA